MIILYLSELHIWLRTKNQWSKWAKFKMVCWLGSFLYTTLAIILLSWSHLAYENLSWLVIGLYTLNYPALWIFQPYVVKSHKLKWKRPYETPKRKEI